MFAIVTQTLRLTLRRWPQLLAWFLAGWLARYVIVELAAIVGMTSLLGALLILPLAVLARLVSFVAMFLVLRQDMPQLQRIAPPPPATARARRREFLDAVLISILPFFAFYYAWGFLKEDTFQYENAAIDNFTSTTEFFEGTSGSYSDVAQLQFDGVTIPIIVIAFGVRWILKRFSAKLPRWTAIVGTYLEAVWVYLTIYLISDLFSGIGEWVNSRQAMVWLGDIRGWLGEYLTPFAVVWDAVLWALGEVGGIILQPLAWLAIAGVIYGRAIAREKVVVPGSERLAPVQQRWSRLPDWARRRLNDLSQGFTGRFKPIWNALVTMWQAGAVPMGMFVFSYAVVLALHGWLQWAIYRGLGPNDLFTFWQLVDALIALAVMIVVEPLRVCLVAAAYDYALGRQTPAEIAELVEPIPDASGPAADPADTAGDITASLAPRSTESAEAPPPRSPAG